MSIINESIMTLSGMEYYEGKNKDRLKNELAKKVPTTRKINSKALTSDITLSASDVGLGNVGNFKAVSTVASQGLTDTEKSNARANIGAQPSGNYASASHTHDDRYYTESEINTKLNGKANSSHTHGNGDITSLDAGKITSGTISIDRLPQGALERLIIVADDTARFKLTSKTVQKGDTVKVTATSKMYYVVDESKLSTEAGYEVYTAGSATSVPWSGVTGKPGTFTPSSHTHDDRYYTESEIDSKLSGKANSSHTHTKSQITDFPTSMPASDVPAWAKASTKPSYTKSEVGLGNVDNTADSAKSVKYATSAGSASSATNASKVNNHTVESNVPANAKFTDTTYSNFVKSGSGAKNGLVPAPSTTAGTTKYLREDGTWQTPPNTNTWTAFKGATSSAAGTAGYVPAPAKGEQTKFFRADGTWQTVSAGGNKTAYQKTEPTGQSNNDEWLKEY